MKLRKRERKEVSKWRRNVTVWKGKVKLQVSEGR